jgi:hypothetical protein
MHRLSESNRVIYAEDPVAMLAPFMAASHWRRRKAVFPRLRQADASLWTLTRPRVNLVNQAMSLWRGGAG